MTEPVAQKLIDAFVADEPAEFQEHARTHLKAKWEKHGVPEGEVRTVAHLAAKMGLNA